MGQFSARQYSLPYGGLQRDINSPTELTIITNNGIVQHFRAQANRPPLLVNPESSVGTNNYTISVELLNIEENDAILLRSRSTMRRLAIGFCLRMPIRAVKTCGCGKSTTPATNEGLRYRFRYDDGSNVGIVEPALGPAPLVRQPPSNSWPVYAAISLVVLGIVAGFYYQQRTLDTRVRRFYGRVKKQPRATLQLLEVAYSMSSASPDYLLNLASQARQDGDRSLASLADGLYLLNDRPEAGLPIINGALADAAHRTPQWRDLVEWQRRFRVGEALYSAPSITELSLLRHA